MRVSPIMSYKAYSNVKNVRKVSDNPASSSVQTEVGFKGKHDCAKLIGGITGSLGALGATGGLLIMTGGVALPIVAGYAAICAGMGAAFGHQVDKDIAKNEKKEKEDK